MYSKILAPGLSKAHHVALLQQQIGFHFTQADGTFIILAVPVALIGAIATAVVRARRRSLGV